jgi:hypothetical protein
LPKQPLFNRQFSMCQDHCIVYLFELFLLLYRLVFHLQISFRFFCYLFFSRCLLSVWTSYLSIQAFIQSHYQFYSPKHLLSQVMFPHCIIIDLSWIQPFHVLPIGFCLILLKRSLNLAFPIWYTNIILGNISSVPLGLWFLFFPFNPLI